MKEELLINNKIFKKSSFSKDDTYCVGVNFDGEKIYIVNTKDKSKTMCSFSQQEWNAFIKGVKNKEFDF